MEDELIRKWGSLGFLENIPQDRHGMISQYYESMPIFILSEIGISEEDNTQRRVESLIFPFIRGVVIRGGEINNIPTFYDEVYNFISYHETDIINHIGDLDYFMVELLTSFCDSYIQRNSNSRDPLTPIKYIKPWMK